MFSYVVTYFNSDERKTVTEKGILAAATYGKAADKLVKYYGKEYLVTLVLTELDDILTKDLIEEELRINYVS